MTVAVVREPLYRHAPDCRESFGDIAAQLAVDLGWVPDTEMRFALDAIFDESSPGIPRSPEVALVAPRQNLKTATLEVAALTDVLVMGLAHIWTAHLTSTSTKTFLDMLGRLQANDGYRELMEVKRGRGEEKLIVRDTSVGLEFYARHGGGGRGFMGVPRITLDEALYLRAPDVAALGPTMVTRRDMQVRYASSAGLFASEVLRSIRQRGRAGSPGLVYVEYGAPVTECDASPCPHLPGTDGCALDDRELWWQANPALWAGRITEDSLATQRRLMAADPRDFGREFLSWWDDPPEGGGILDPHAWAALASEAAGPVQPVMAVEIPQGRAVALIGAAWLPAPGAHPHLELVEVGEGTTWVVDRLKSFKTKYRLRTVVVDAGTEAAQLIPDLEAAGLKVLKVGSSERAAACGGLYDRAATGRLSHNGDPALGSALVAARWKDFGDGARVFTRRGSEGDISALYAVTLALHDLTVGRRRVPMVASV